MNLKSTWLSLGFRTKLLILFIAGGLSVAALPPILLTPAVIPGFVILFWSLQVETRPRNAFWYGWVWGFGYFVAGLYWLGHAIAVDLATYWWALPFALFGFQSCLAIFYGLAALVANLIKTRFSLNDWALLLCLTATWLIVDGLRSTILTGFPWNLLGTMWLVSDATIQAAAWGGVHLLTIAGLIWAMSLGLVTRRSIAAPLLVFLAVPLALYVSGNLRIKQNEVHVAKNVDGVYMRLIQANIAQSLKWDLKVREQNLRRHMDLSLAPNPTKTPITLMIWPETAVYFPLNRFDDARTNLASQIAPQDGLFITGGNREDRTQTSFQAWNHLYVLDKSGKRVAGYDKHHLVPFGEFTPLESLLSSLKLTPGTVGFSRGPGPQTLDLPGLPKVAPIICYEGIFSGNVTDRNERPEWLLSITNDGWFGLSTGPHQHLAATKLRAVEEGLPLVRVSNPGVSVITDAIGRERGRTELGKEAILDGPLPVSLGVTTVFSRLGSSLIWLLLGALFLSVIVARLVPNFFTSNTKLDDEG